MQYLQGGCYQSGFDVAEIFSSDSEGQGRDLAQLSEAEDHSELDRNAG